MYLKNKVMKNKDNTLKKLKTRMNKLGYNYLGDIYIPKKHGILTNPSIKIPKKITMWDVLEIERFLTEPIKVYYKYKDQAGCRISQAGFYKKKYKLIKR